MFGGSDRHRPVGRHAVALDELLDVQRLVDQVLDGLAEVELVKILPALPPSPVELKLYGK